MSIGRNRIIRSIVLYLSMLSILCYSAKLCGIQTIMAATVTEEIGGDSYIIIAEDESTIEDLKDGYESSDTISETSQNCMEQKNIISCELSSAEAKELQDQDGILQVEKDSTIKANSSIKNRKVKKKEQSELKNEWNMEMINADSDDCIDASEKIKVAVIDSGVDFGNDVELKNYIDLVPGYEECLPYYTDITGHGSSVAGIIAAEDNDTGITGINPSVELYSARVLDEDNVAPVSRVIEAIYWAIDQDVNIINMSFGMNDDSEALHKAIKDAYKAGILLIAAAGNGDSVEYPAAYSEVVAVGAVDSQGCISEDSASGDEVELVAPGEEVASTGAFQGTLVCSGTSMAAPHVTGVASLLWQKDKDVSADFIRALLCASANGYGESSSYGNGLIDYEYAEEIYDSFKETYQSESEEEAIESYENESAINAIEENGYIEGSWASAQHKSLISNTGSLSSTNVSTIKEGAVYPDTTASGISGLKNNPGFHGKGNYVLNAIYLSYIANDGSIKNASNYFSDDILSTYQSSLDVMYNKLLTCKNNGDITNKYFLWGIAIHTLSDSFSHNSVIQDPDTSKWYHLVHSTSDNAGKDGYITEADNPYVARARYDSAQASVDLGLYYLLNGNGWSYHVYQHEDYFNTYSDRSSEGYPYYNWSFKMTYLYNYAKEIDYGANYSDILKQATYGNVK